MKSTPALPGGSLTSKPTWSNACGCSTTSAFLCCALARAAAKLSLRQRCFCDSPRRSYGLLMQVKEECDMRFPMTSFAILLALVTCGPNVLSDAQGGDTGKTTGTEGVAGAPALPPTPTPVPAPTLAPTAPSVRAPALAPPAPPVPASTLGPPVPSGSAPTFAPTVPPASARTLAPPVSAPGLAPGPVLSRAPAGQTRDGFGNPGVPQTPIVNPNAGLPSSANTVIVANPGGDQWRYRWHNGPWWYWTTENRWVYRNGNAWINYEPAAAVAPL